MTNPYPTLLPQDFANYGKVRKTHGHQGELGISLDSEVLWELDPEFLFPIIDEIAIPFQVESIKGNSSQLIIKLQGIDDLSSAEKLVGCKLMILKRELPETIETNHLDLIGYTLTHVDGETIGSVISIDDTTLNTLLLVEQGDANKSVTIPLVDEWIVHIDESEQTIMLDFPKELLDL